jgi:hypothetical protein
MERGMANTWQEWAAGNPSKMQNSGATAFEPAPKVAVPAPTQFSGPLSLQPQFDVIEALPPAAGERLRALRQRSADTHSIIPEFETIREASTARVEAENALKRLVAHPSENGFGLKDDDPRVITAQKHLDKMTADFARLRALREARTAQWQAASAALANTETWLKSGRPGGTTLEDAKEAQPQLHKGESVIDGVDGCVAVAASCGLICIASKVRRTLRAMPRRRCARLWSKPLREVRRRFRCWSSMTGKRLVGP